MQEGQEHHGESRPQPDRSGGGQQNGADHQGGMGMRGVSRPMAERQMREMKHDMSDREGREHMLVMHHQQTLWVYWMIVLLGAWMILAPLTFGYGTGTVQPTGRSVWLGLETRVALMMWSDILSGVLLMIFGWRGLTPNRPVSLWVCCFVGIWITMAPVLFWAPTAVAYLNDTLVGAFVIGLTILVPGMPNMIMYMAHGPERPPGWSYNPSSWPQRAIMIGLGFAGWVVSRYLAAFQLGYIDTMWDPFFGQGSTRVLTSNMSTSLPISDAALGSFAYTFEFLMGWMGSQSRWRTMPWMVTFFGILVIPLGLVHIFLVISQPVIVGSWCTFCIVAAAIMLPMIPLEFDEVGAMVQYMRQARKRGEPFWKTFWKGGTVEDGGPDDRSPKFIAFPQNKVAVFRASVWGMSVPWTLALSAAIGVWLMFVPSVFGLDAWAKNIHIIGGALIVTVSVICMGEIVRIGRLANVVLGAVVAVGPWFFTNSATALFSSTVAGVAVLLLAIPRGKIRERYGIWDSVVI